MVGAAPTSAPVPDSPPCVVLAFYSLESLSPTEWVQTEPEAAVAVPSQPPGASRSALRGEASAEQLLSSLEALDKARQLLRDDFDPLDLKDSSFVRQAQLSRTAMHKEHSLHSMQSVQSLEEIASTTSITEPPPVAATAAASIVLTRENFDARLFLKTVHGDTSYADLLRGRENLMRATRHRNESLKNLVKQNFDRFINAKNSTELVFRDMQSRRLTDKDHGMRRALEALSAAYQRASDVYGSLMRRREQEQGIRRRLEIFSRYSFIFTLGYRLEQALRLGEYQSAVADYRKARSIIQGVTSGTLQAILQKIWSGHIEKVLAELRSDLSRKLASPIFSYKIHSRLIGFLLDLDTHPDPALTFFTARTDTLLLAIRHACKQTLQELTQVTPDIDAAAVPRILLGLVQSRQRHQISALRVDIVRCWKIRASFTSTMVDTFNRFFGEFSQFITALLAGRFSRHLPDPAAAIRSHEQRLQAFCSDLCTLLPDALAAVLADSALAQSGIQESSVAALHYAIKASRQLCSMLGAVGGDSKAPPVIGQATQLLVEKTILIYLNVIWNSADEDCALLPHYETWQASGEGFDFSTVLIKGIETLLISLIDGSAAILHGYREAQATAIATAFSGAGLDDRLADALCSLLGALRDLALGTAETGTADAADQIVTSVDSQRTSTGLENLGHSYRLLTVLTNLQYLRRVAIPRTLAIFSDSLPDLTLSDEARARIAGRLDEVEEETRQAFLRLKRIRLLALVATGLLESGFDWADDLRPGPIRPYVLTILLELVAIQTQISDVSTTILRSIMSELVLDIFQEFLRCVQAIQRFSARGQIQVRAEAVLLQQRLITIMNEETLEVYATIMGVLDAACEHPPPAEEAKKTIDSLVHTIEGGTSMAFACFQYT